MTEFRATIEEARGGGGAWVQVPPPAVAELGGGSRIPVRATFDGVPYQGSVVSMGDDRMVIGVLKDIRSKLGKQVGDELLVTLTRDDGPRAIEVPDDLANAMRAAGVSADFEELSYTRRKEIATGVTGAKKPETRQRRIAAANAELA